MKEVWKDIPDYEDYQVSDKGNVRSKDRIIYNILGHTSHFKGKLKKLSYNYRGYLQTSLTKNKKSYTLRVHRLVAFTFIGSPVGDRNQVNHKNGIRDDNRLENLEWVSYEENMQHSVDVLGNEIPKGERHANSILTQEDVLFIRSHHIIRDKKYSTALLAKMFDTSGTTINNIVSRRSWKHI